jgi:DNA-binding transcriptional ArsR family regulator
MDWDAFTDTAEATRELQRIINAIAHPAPRFVIGLLQYGGTYATDLATSVEANFGLSVPRASQYLTALERAGLVSVVHENQWRYYSVRTGGAAPLAEWLSDTGLSASEADRGFG